MTGRMMVTLLGLAINAVDGQTKPLAVSARMAKAPQIASVADAEKEGVSWPRSTLKETSYPTTHVDVGGPERRCVRPLPGQQIARSGEFMIGGAVTPTSSVTFASTIGALKTTKGTNKIWWKPMHP